MVGTLDSCYDIGHEPVDWDESWGYNVSIAITAIKGLELTEGKLVGLTYRLICDCGNYTHECTTVDMENKVVYFEQGATCLVGENILFSDNHTFQIQILEKTDGLLIGSVKGVTAELMDEESGADVVMPSLPFSCSYECSIVIRTMYVKASIPSSVDEYGDY